MDIFTNARDLLNKEIQTYKATFDYESEQALNNANQNHQSEKDNFDNEIQTGISDFNAEYAAEVQTLKVHVGAKKKQLEDANAHNALELMKYKDQIKTNTMNVLMQKIYGIRVLFDADDDHLASPYLEGASQVNAQILQLQHFLLGNSSMAEDMQILAQIYQVHVGSAPPSLEFADLYPVIAVLMARVSEGSVPLKTIRLTNNPNYDEHIAKYSQQPNMVQSATWTVLRESFKMDDSFNSRLTDHFSTIDYNDDSAKFYMALHIVNRYREIAPYVPAHPQQYQNIFAFNIANEIGDSVLLAAPTYYSKEGLELLFQRSMCSMLLKYDSVNEKYICDMSAVDNLMQMHDYYYKFGGIVTFDKDMKLESINIGGENQPLDNEIVYKRIIATAMTYGTWGIHFGIQHAIISDDWNYQFGQKVYSKDNNHPLAALVKPLCVGVQEIMNLASLVLVNKLDTSIAAGNNIRGKDISGMRSEFLADVYKVAHWPTMRNHIFGSLDNEITRSFDAWWTLMHGTMTNYVNIYYQDDDSVVHDINVAEWLTQINMNVSKASLIDTLTMMFFNQITHELFSNPQIIHDLITLKLQYVVRNDYDHGLPSYFVHLRNIETLVVTNGGTSRFINIEMEQFVVDDNQVAKDVLVQFRTDVQNLAAEFDNNPDRYLPLLHPSLIESSIAW